MSLTFHDMFCGAGGSTLGAHMAGARPVIGMNHWPVACESYEANHAASGAAVACVDVVTQDPRRYPSADMLLASPECTHHSYARGRPKDDASLFDPAGDMGAERSRATMWDVVRFAEAHEYRMVIVENVEAAVKWGLQRGTKLRHGDYGPLFSAWLNAMTALGYEHRLVHLNSMVCGVPQSRDRLYVVFWRRGQRAPDLNITALAWCPTCDDLVDAEQRWKRPGASTGTYGQQYTYVCPRCSSPTALAVRPAAAAIDWTLEAVRIGERDRPLKPATMARIRRGLARLRDRPATMRLPSGLVVQVGAHLFEREGYARAWSTDEPLKAVTATSDRGLVLSNMMHGVPKLASDEPAGTVTTGNKLALVYAGRETAIPRPAHDGPDSDALGTIEQHALVGEVTDEEIEACTFRMLQPHELKLASGFTEDYVLAGNKRDRVAQIGNAVTAPAEAELVRRCLESLDPA